MRDVLLVGLLVLLLCAPVQRAFGQEAPPQDELPGELRRPGLPQDTVQFAPEPIVIETALFTLEIDVGVLLETYCYKPVRIDPCGDVRPLLGEHGVMSEIVAEITRQLEVDLESITEDVETSYRQEIRRNLERYLAMEPAGREPEGNR